ncbi:MAG: hypothetical protein KIS91_11120 [Anaerolineae bacterium]|nr:hypothetical protein [Anaerolineae bacterium]
MITLAIAEKVAALMTDDYLRQRAARSSHARFEAALSRAPDAEPDERDRLPGG